MNLLHSLTYEVNNAIGFDSIGFEHILKETEKIMGKTKNKYL